MLRYADAQRQHRRSLVLQHAQQQTWLQALVLCGPSDAGHWLLPLLPRPELADEIMQTVVDAKAVQALVDGGMITRSQMEREGALIREPKTRPFIKLEPIKGVRP